jgi:hypothetical protein
MTAAAISGASDLQELGSILDGELITPKDPSFDEKRSVWNGMIDKRPAAIVRARNEKDVQRTVVFASGGDLLLAVKGPERDEHRDS